MSHICRCPSSVVQAKTVDCAGDQRTSVTGLLELWQQSGGIERRHVQTHPAGAPRDESLPLCATGASSAAALSSKLHDINILLMARHPSSVLEMYTTCVTVCGSRPTSPFLMDHWTTRPSEETDTRDSPWPSRLSTHCSFHTGPECFPFLCVLSKTGVSDRKRIS
eukprot:scaffold1637_cov410-Prasinococcus_capsulatus_cf.AAC.32